MLDHDLVERLETVNRSKCLAVFLHHAKPSGMIRRVRWFVNTCFNLPLDDCADVFEDAGWNRDVVFDPGGMWNDGELDRGKEICSKVASFIFMPREAGFMTSNKIVHKVSLFWPQEIAGMILVDDGFAFEGISGGRDEGWGSRIEFRHVFEWVASDVSNDTKSIWKVCDDWPNFL